MKYYAGIGSRETPRDICEKMTRIASTLEELGYCLRSGGADGADTAFDVGVKCQLVKEIYLPWKDFNSHPSSLFITDDVYFRKVKNPLFDKAYDLAKKYHPAWDKLKDPAKRMMIRNIYQVLGWDMEVPVEFIICWTKDGSATGGTGQALRYAMDNRIKIYNLYIDWEIKELCEFVKKLKTSNKQTNK